jgi:exosortase/archaeosortase family protein
LAFLVRFLVLAFVLSAAYAYPYAADSPIELGVARYLEGYAHTAGAVLGLFDSQVHVEGAEVLGRYSLRIVKDCDAMDVNILLGSAILAFPASLGWRAAGLVSGFLAVFVMNLARICLLYFIGVSAPGVFEFAHRELFPLVLVVLVGGLFVVWARRAGSPLTLSSANAAD